MALNEEAVVAFLHHVADSVHWRSSETKDRATEALSNVVAPDEVKEEEKPEEAGNDS